MKLPPALKALLAQLAGCLLALGAARSGLLPAGLWPLVAVQAVGAAGAAIALRSAPWWRWIHLGFIPLVVGALQLGIAPGWYLAAFVAFALVYWSSFRTQVPLFLSNPQTAAAVAELLPRDYPTRLLDLGSGTGALLQHLSLLFVPAGAGVMLHLQRIESEWLPITVALIVSTFAGMAVTGFVLRAMTRGHAHDAGKEDA